MKYKAEEWQDRINDAISKTTNMTSAYKLLGLERKTFKRMAEELGVYKPNPGDTTNHKKEPRIKIPISDILSNKVNFQSHKLKLRLLKEKIFDRKCYICNLSQWNEKPIPLELHHKDGNRNNNKIDNLILLCPNCHAQTNTYRSKNIKKRVETLCSLS